MVQIVTETTLVISCQYRITYQDYSQHFVNHLSILAIEDLNYFGIL